MNKNVIIGIVAVVVLGVVGFIFIGGDEDSPSSAPAGSTCSLYGLVDEYQGMVDDMNSLSDDDFDGMMEIMSALEGWMNGWQEALDDSDCSEEEMLDAANKLDAIVRTIEY